MEDSRFITSGVIASSPLLHSSLLLERKHFSAGILPIYPFLARYLGGRMGRIKCQLSLCTVAESALIFPIGFI